MAARYTVEEMMVMDPMLLRMHLRERVHHTLEHQLYLVIYGERSAGPRLGNTARRILDVWEKRGGRRGASPVTFPTSGGSTS